MPSMNIKADIKAYLEATGMSAAALAKQVDVAPPVITRILTGERSGCHSSTLEKLWPVLYGPGSPLNPLPMVASCTENASK